MQIVTSISSQPEAAVYEMEVIGWAVPAWRQHCLPPTVGGTTARFAGTTWIPGTHHSVSVNKTDTLDDAARYLTNAVGGRTLATLRQAFLDNGPLMFGYWAICSPCRACPSPSSRCWAA